MSSWWDLGEWSGFDGEELALWRITCPFCLEKGNFSIEHHAEKKKPNAQKKLNFEVINMDMEKIKNYLDHLDREGLYQIIQSFLNDSSTKDMISGMADEWDKMYGKLD